MDVANADLLASASMKGACLGDPAGFNRSGGSCAGHVSASPARDENALSWRLPGSETTRARGSATRPCQGALIGVTGPRAGRRKGGRLDGIGGSWRHRGCEKGKVGQLGVCPTSHLLMASLALGAGGSSVSFGTLNGWRASPGERGNATSRRHRLRELAQASMKGPSRRRGNGGRGNRAPTRHYTGRLRAVLKKDGSRVED